MSIGRKKVETAGFNPTIQDRSRSHFLPVCLLEGSSAYSTSLMLVDYYMKSYHLLLNNDVIATT